MIFLLSKYAIAKDLVIRHSLLIRKSEQRITFTLHAVLPDFQTKKSYL